MFKTLNKTANIPAPSFSQCPAKTFQKDGVVAIGRMVPDHCQIVGEVARALIGRYPEDLAKQLFPAGAPLVAACHDIGKVSPCFFEKLRRACQPSSYGMPTIPVNPDIERGWGGHSGVSQATAKEINAPAFVPEILGQHHGYSPTLAGKKANDEVFGGPLWQEQRRDLVNELKTRLKMDWPQSLSVAQARVLAGLTSVADWIGSGQHFEDPGLDWKPNIDRALDEAGFLPPRYHRGLFFWDVFGSQFSPRAVQTQLIEAVTSPGVYVLEAPMGVGKTEAALFAAYRLLERGQASGIYFALPTQLTSNKIFERFNAFLDRVLADDCPRRALLLHANAWLVDTEMGEEGRPGGAWFHHRKRGLLAPFAVGTIDQALMAAMNVKHGFVRAFGLAGKVVILDEVHTYDAYTGTLLDALVHLLRELHCTVIILSATLNHARRSSLLGSPVQSDAYPLITAQAGSEPVREIHVAADSTACVTIRTQQDDRVAVQGALDRATGGQQVLWIENTVRGAQERYLDLAARARDAGVECGLLHSRFTMSDRQVLEGKWVGLFGKSGISQRGDCGRILVGTQVLEQSLDIDADFLVTRFAPTDMLLQRMGRLWRHAATRRPRGAQCEAWLLAPAVDTAIKSPQSDDEGFGASAFVYSPYVLCRSLEVWSGRTAVNLPREIRALIESTYAPRDEHGAMATMLHNLEYGTPRRPGRVTLGQLARVGLAMEGTTKPESMAQTRYSETDNFDVLLLRTIHLDSGKQVTRIHLLNGDTVDLPWRKRDLDIQSWRLLSARLMGSIVPVRAGEAPAAVSRNTLEKHGFQHCFYLGDPNWPDETSLLRVACVDDAGALVSLDGSSAASDRELTYRPWSGYHVGRR